MEASLAADRIRDLQDLAEVSWGIVRRVEELLQRGMLGKQIAMVLRDEGHPIYDVQIVLVRFGFFVSGEMFLDLKGLFVSDYKLGEDEDQPIYSGNQAGRSLAIWVRNPGPRRNAHLN